MKSDISNMRENYKWGHLLESHVLENPVEQFRLWLEEAVNSKLPEPNAMNLATANKAGHPSSRIVLLKEVQDEGLVFYTNYDSRKARELSEQPHAALNFLWKEIERQVRIEGVVAKISREKSEAYFHSRPFGSQLGALASQQSNRISDRSILEDRYERLRNKYGSEEQAPMPENWGGYLLKPHYFEFWQGRESRLHDRLEYTLKENGSWNIHRLEP